MWVNFIKRLALFVSVVWTLIIWGTGFVVVTHDISLMYTNPLEFMAVIVLYNLIWIVGVVFVYAIAWVLTGKNVLPGRSNTKKFLDRIPAL